ncbi:MAG: hypothetical protein QOH41_2268 [Blastocatellia bacterium]|jgi:hypothetical protein|nr:hypothetical protein [Blastocatellia bacterium]
MTIDSTNGKMLLKPLAAFLLLLLPLLVFAQNGTPAPKPATADQFAGSYKGTAKDPGGAIALTLEIKSENGKISGRLIAPKSEQAFTSSDLADGKLTAKFGSGDTAGTLVLRLRDNKLVGDWKAGAQTRPVEFERVPVNPAVAEVKKATAPAPADLLSGDWDAAADAQGQAVPFTLSLKVEGEKVTGTSVSQLGDSTISSGSWKEGKLAVVLDSANGQVALVGTMVDGKLVGDFDYNGQLQGKWVATKKKP